MATSPFEILYGPAEVYTGPVNEARPDLEDAPAGNWTLLGTSGSKSYSEDGVIITPENTVDELFVLGSTGPRKAHRSQERLMVSATIIDMTAEHLAKVFNSATVTDTAPGSGTAGVRDFDLLRGSTVTEIAILIRIAFGAYIDAAASQWWIPRAYVAAVNEIVYMKGTPAQWEVEFAALDHTTSGFGKYEVQDEQGS